MSFWSRIASFITGGGTMDNRSLAIYVMSNRCREPIAGKVDLPNELSRTEDEDGFYTRKVLHTSGETRCFDQVEVELWFDRRKQIRRYEVVGGRWLDTDEYQAELERFNAEPEEDIDIPEGEGEDALQPSDALDSQDTDDKNAK